MALEGEAHLHHAPAKEDQADGPDEGKDKVAQVADHRQGIPVGKDGDRHRPRQQGGGKQGEGEFPSLSQPVSYTHLAG